MAYQSGAWASDNESVTPNYENSDERGWYWYQQEPVAPEPEKPEKPKPSAKPGQKSAVNKEGPDVFSVKWIQENLPKYRDKAIDNPTNVNMAAYMYLNKMSLDKAHVFSNKFKELSSLDPLLGEGSRYPFDAVSKAAMRRSKQIGVEDIIKGNLDKFGLWYFYSNDCIHCKQQNKPLSHLLDRYDIKMSVISKSRVGIPKGFKYRKESGQFKALNLRVTPSIVMAIPPNKFHVIGEGSVTLPEIENRIVLALHHEGMVSKEQYDKANPMDKGIIRNSDIEKTGINTINGDDPNSWLPALRETMGVSDGLYDFNSEQDSKEQETEYDK